MEGKEESSSKTCLFKRVKRGGINSGRRTNKQPTSGSSSDSSDNEIYKKAKKNRSGLVQSTSAFKKDSSRKRKWQKHVSLYRFEEEGFTANERKL